jgi:hypothetical protein
VWESLELRENGLEVWEWLGLANIAVRESSGTDRHESVKRAGWKVQVKLEALGKKEAGPGRKLD